MSYLPPPVHPEALKCYLNVLDQEGRLTIGPRKGSLRDARIIGQALADLTGKMIDVREDDHTDMLRLFYHASGNEELPPPLDVFAPVRKEEGPMTFIRGFCVTSGEVYPVRLYYFQRKDGTFCYVVLARDIGEARALLDNDYPLHGELEVDVRGFDPTSVIPIKLVAGAET